VKWSEIRCQVDKKTGGASIVTVIVTVTQYFISRSGKGVTPYRRAKTQRKNSTPARNISD
jgi:hypothetical protein